MMKRVRTLVHVTHEAVGKIGGIGAVLHGLLTCREYINSVERSILISPLFNPEHSLADRLGENSEVLYSTVDGVAKTVYSKAFRKVEDSYNVDIVYGKRLFSEAQSGCTSSPEVLLIDVRHCDRGHINQFKRGLFEEFGIRSDLYENVWEYEQYVRLAPAAIAALKAMGAAHSETIIAAHEFMGMPTALAAILEPDCNFRTVFYAHEVATMRRIVEEHPGHDTMFYNALKYARENELYVNDVFGDQSGFFKHPLVEAAKHCDGICAVGDFTAKELQFLAPEFKRADINIVYNGIPAQKIGVGEKLASKAKLQLYCDNLLGYSPDVIFTHVTRLVQSKGLWRDLRVLEHIERQFRAQGKTGVMFLLSTETSQRSIEDIEQMESLYGWPVAHREGLPDLSGGEAAFYTAIQEFNAKSRSIKIVFLNQFGFERKYCGSRMPEDMEFMDIRKGSDVEFGLSIYEPFGISQLETLTFGGICVVTNVCGCAAFSQDAAGAQKNPNIIVADYTNLNSYGYDYSNDLLSIGRSVRNGIEMHVSADVAMQIVERLTKSRTELENMVDAGYDLAKHMSWQVVCKNHLLPSLQKALQRQRPVVAYTNG